MSRDAGKSKNQKQWLSFDDLLTQLSASIDTDETALLTERIRTLYPVAMIDEFQDTDPLQYSIFSRIYLDNPECGLFMIGDPKQAIYGFRGADIFTYIKARNQVSAHYTLGTNWRSSADMVLAVNQILLCQIARLFTTPTFHSTPWITAQVPTNAFGPWVVKTACTDLLAARSGR